MSYQRKTKPALWQTAFPEQVKLKPEKKRRFLGMSLKRREESKQYRKLRLVFLASRPRCERCGKPSQCVHHWAGRRSNYLKVETWKASCLACNDYAKQDPKEARAEKWIAELGIYLA